MRLLIRCLDNEGLQILEVIVGFQKDTNKDILISWEYKKGSENIYFILTMDDVESCYKFLNSRIL